MKKIRLGFLTYIIVLVTIILGFYRFNLIKQEDKLSIEMNKTVDFIEAILPRTYHDRVLNDEVIEQDEHQEITKLLTRLADLNNFRVTYTMLIKEDSLLYSTSSVSIESLNLENYGVLLEKVNFNENSIYDEKILLLLGELESFDGIYENKRGEYRALIKPFKTKGGNTYLIGVEYDLKKYKNFVQLETVYGLLTDVLFLFLTIPLIVYIYKRFKIEKKVILDEGMKDTLTGLYNRKALNMIKKKKSHAPHTKCAAFYFDLDGLKKINDSLGHHAGDEYITKFSDILKSNFRNTDFLLRVGGDEFLVIADYNADKFIDEVKIRLLDASTVSNVFFSIGIETFNTTDISRLDEIIKLADEKMYAEKARKYSK